jgi:trehalose 6-phosphate phosphatase
MLARQYAIAMPPPSDSGIERPPRPRSAAAAIPLTVARAADSAFFFDFDGTLAPIADDPHGVQPVAGVLDAITELAGRVRRVVIVSARPARFLLERFGEMPDVSLYGLYGLEVHRNGTTETDPDALPYAGRMAELADLARVELPSSVLVEFKGLSVALHYRMAPELAGEVQAWAAEQRERHQLAAQNGRMVVELKPPVSRNKGNVVLDETADCVTCAWYFGDDVSDLYAFAALDEREATDPGFIGVRVAVTNLETGADLAAAADFRLDSPTDVVDLIAQVSGQPAR